MRRPMVAGNWKMNGSQAEAATLLAEISQGLATLKQVDVVVCPPFILIPLIAAQLKGSPMSWGGQNLSTHTSRLYRRGFRYDVAGFWLYLCHSRSL